MKTQEEDIKNKMISYLLLGHSISNSEKEKYKEIKNGKGRKNKKG